MHRREIPHAHTPRTEVGIGVANPSQTFIYENTNVQIHPKSLLFKTFFLVTPLSFLRTPVAPRKFL